MRFILFFSVNLLMFYTAYTTTFFLKKDKLLSEKLITALLFYFSQITLTLLILGVIFQNLHIVPIIGLNCYICIIILIFLKNYIKDATIDLIKDFSHFFGDIIKSKDWFLYIIIILFIGEVSWVLLKILYFPTHVWDSFAYHVHPVVEWFQRNMIPTSIDTPVVRLNRNPLGVKLFIYWIGVFTGNMTWFELPQMISGIIIILVSYTLMLKMKIQKISALKYALSIYFIPLILLESRTCQDHLVLMGITMMALYFFLEVFLEKNNKEILFLAFAMGLLLGAKISGLHIIIIFFPALFLVKGFNLRAIQKFIRENYLSLITGILSIIILGGFWYLKDNFIWRAYSNTIKRLPMIKLGIIFLLTTALIYLSYLLLRKWDWRNFFKNKKVIIIGIIIFAVFFLSLILLNTGLIKTFILSSENPRPLLSEKSFFDQHPVLKKINGDFLKNILLFPSRIKDIGMHVGYTPDFLEQSGFGIQFFGFGLLAYLIMTYLFFRSKYRNSISGYLYIFSVLLLLSYFIYYFTAANYRLFMFFPIIGLMLWAFICTEMSLKPIFVKFIDFLMLIMIIFNIGVTLFDGNTDSFKVKTLFTMENTDDRTSVTYSSFFNKKEDYRFIDSYLKPNEPIGFLGNTDSWISPYFDNQMKRHIFHLESLAGFSLISIDGERDLLDWNETLKTNLKKRNIHFLHINPQGFRSKNYKLKRIIVDNPEIIRITKNLYYYKY